MGLLYFVRLLLRYGTDHFRSHAQLRAENALLRHQLLIATRQKKRPRLTASDRAIFVWLYRRFPGMFDALVLLTPQTIIRWHRAGYSFFWRWKSQHRSGRPPKDRELIELIRNLCRENPLWGAPRIHGEIKKLGYDDICEATVAKYMLRRLPGGRAQNWRAFLRLHAKQITAVDMLTVPTLGFDRLYAFIVLGLGRREILRIEVTMHPTALWLAQQITEAFPWDTAPKFIVRDNDGAYGTVFRSRVQAMGICDCPISPHSPWQNGYAERVIGSIRRECLDHIIPINAEHLRSALEEYVKYYNDDRTHLALGKDSPHSRPVETQGTIVSRRILGGLHHRYRRI